MNAECDMRIEFFDIEICAIEELFIIIIIIIIIIIWAELRETG